MNTPLRLSIPNKQNTGFIRQFKSFIPFLFTLLGFFPNQAIGEGSKELYVGNNGGTRLYLCNDFLQHCNGPWGSGDRSQFAVYGCDSLERLYFIINSPNEIAYMGFRGGDNGIVYRIKKTNGTTAGQPIQAQTNLPGIGQVGYINNIDEARIGPVPVGGFGGYVPLEFGGLDPGLYFIEFNIAGSSFNIQLFDITIADENKNPIRGRVYSHAWQLTSYQDNNRCNATFFIYSNDSIITSLTLNNMSGGVWVTYCNQWGAGSTGDWMIDRMSLNQQSSYVPQYRLFLNEPDANLYPPASTLGNIIPPVLTQTFCDDGRIEFNVTVDKPGNVEVILTFTNPIYQPRTMSATVEIGPNSIFWDGYDGSSTPQMVPNGAEISFQVSYINGLTNLPLYDVETNNNGFYIELVNPQPPPNSPPLMVYWDDSNVNGNVNLTGCESTQVPWSGCHTWPDGDYHTMNTWWYNVSNSTDAVVIFEERKPQLMVFDQVPPQIYCAGSTGNIFSVLQELNTEVYHWNYTGTGFTMNQDPDNPWIVTMEFTQTATNGTLEVYGTNANCSGNGPTATLDITILPSAIVDAGPALSTCELTPIQIDGSASNYSNITWTTGSSGTFNNTHLEKPTYTPSSEDVQTGSVVLTLTAIPNLPCTDPVADQMTLAINLAPTAFAGNDSTLCMDGSFTFFHADTTNSNSLTWSNNGGEGTFDDPTLLHSTYTPGPGDLASPTITLTLAAHPSPTSSCIDDATSDIVLTIQPVPVADAGGDATICDIETYSPPLASADYFGTHTWTHNGDGSFDDPTLIQPVYTPGPTDITSGSVTLTLTCTAIAPCTDDVSSSMTLSI
ncbi:MAG: hypothetical protein WC341_15245, partial [Bacteroidales bacterium]